jgi:hypothetical protein
MKALSCILRARALRWADRVSKKSYPEEMKENEKQIKKDRKGICRKEERMR